MTKKTNLFDLNRHDLTAWLKSAGFPSFRAKQLWHFMYYRGLTDAELMHNLPTQLKTYLKEHASLQRPEVSLQQNSQDGTIKWLFKLNDGHEIETVFIPEDDRGTLCISSQIGCTLRCSFCHTGTQNLVRNLTPAEITGQILYVRDHLHEWPDQHDEGQPRLLTNIVLMGMGEPLYNYDNVKTSLTNIMDPDGLAFSKRRITLSTSGVVPRIDDCGRDLGVSLAISLHSPRDDIRNILVPLNKKYPIATLLEACRHYGGSSNARRITFEYTLIDGMNDSLDDAKLLVKLIRDLPAKVNLIPFNPWPGTNYECASKTKIRAFSNYIFSQGIAAPIRTTRGDDILAACGQLKSASQKIRKSELLKAQISAL